jgi:hypothetical protein
MVLYTLRARHQSSLAASARGAALAARAAGWGRGVWHAGVPLLALPGASSPSC